MTAETVTGCSESTAQGSCAVDSFWLGLDASSAFLGIAPLIAALLYGLAGIGNCFIPITASDFLFLLAMTTISLSLKKSSSNNRFLLWYVGLLGAFTVWIALVQMARAALPIAWWGSGLDLLTLTTIWAVGSISRARTLLRLAAIASAWALALGLTSRVFFPKTGWLIIDFGNMNYLANTFTPLLLGFTLDWATSPVRRRHIDTVSIVVGIGSLLTLILWDQRRGALAAIACALLGILFIVGWRRGHRMAVVVVLTTAMLAATWLVVRSYESVPVFGNLRWRLYHSASEVALAGSPWGWGHYGMLKTQELDYESCRHQAKTTDSWATHAHNEPLDAAIDGGPIGLILWIAMGVVLILAIRRNPDARWRLVLSTIWLAQIPIALFDNTNAITMGHWSWAVAAGLALNPGGNAAVSPVASPQKPWLPAVLTGILAVGVGLVTLINLSRTVLVFNGAPAAVMAKYAAYPREPMLQTSFAYQAAALALLQRDDVLLEKVLDQAREIGGLNGLMAGYAADVAGRLHSGLPCIPLILEAGRRDPFSETVYYALDKQIRRHPEVKSALPEAWLDKVEVVCGRRKPLPISELPLATDFESAATLTVHLRRHLSDHGMSPALIPALTSLVQGYADISSVCELVLIAGSTDPVSTIQSIQGRQRALTAGFGVLIEGNLIAKNIPGNRWKNLWPICRQLFPQLEKQFESGVRPPGSAEFVNQMAVIWGAYREDAVRTGRTGTTKLSGKG